MTSDDFVLGVLVGLAARLQPQPDPLATGLFFGAIIAVIVIGLIFCRDLGQQSVDDTAKVIWVIIFFVIPIISWIAYWFVIRKS
ncbi:MAG: hypothetical protein ACFFCM_14015 [Promethearchaeota archaeon]